MIQNTRYGMLNKGYRINRIIKLFSSSHQTKVFPESLLGFPDQPLAGVHLLYQNMDLVGYRDQGGG